MARFEWRPLTGEWTEKLERMGDQTERIAKKALYAGANEIADAIRENLQALPEQGGALKHNKMREGVLPAQKQGLLDSLGITPMDKRDGGYNVKIGFDGYNKIKTKKYPQGQPNPMIASSIESGTTIQQKHRFIDKAMRQKEKAAQKAIEKVVDEEIEKIMK